MKLNFEEFDNFRSLSSNDTELLEAELARNYTRVKSVIIFRHGHRTPFKYRKLISNTLNERFEESFFDNLDPNCFDGVNDLQYENVKLVVFPEECEKFTAARNEMEILTVTEYVLIELINRRSASKCKNALKDKS